MEKKIKMESFENVPEYTGLEKNSACITIKDGCTWDGDRYGAWVGRIYENGDKKSAFKKDKENNSTEIFDKLRNDITLIDKHVTVRQDMKLSNAVDYYIPYKVKGHSSAKPTITESYVDNCSNVRYSVEYEILLVAGEGFTRYITEFFETEGHYASSFFDQIKGIEDLFEEWFEEESHDFRDGEYGKEVAFYDETGEKLYIEISCMSELLSMISSIRVIKCDRKILKKKFRLKFFFRVMWCWNR